MNSSVMIGNTLLIQHYKGIILLDLNAKVGSKIRIWNNEKNLALALQTKQEKETNKSLPRKLIIYSKYVHPTTMNE